MEQLFDLFKQTTGYTLTCDDLKNELNGLPLDVVQNILLNKNGNPAKRKEICNHIKGLPADKWNESVHASLSQIYVMLTFTETNQQPQRRDMVIEQYRHYAVTIWKHLNSLSVGGKTDVFATSLVKTIQDKFNIKLSQPIIQFGHTIIRDFVKIMMNFTLSELQTEPVSRLVDKMMHEMTGISDLCLENKDMLIGEGYALVNIMKDRPEIKEHSIYKNLERFITSPSGELLPLDVIIQQFTSLMGSEDDPLLTGNTGDKSKASSMQMSKLMNIIMSDGSMQNKMTQMFLSSMIPAQNEDERELYKSMTREEQVRHRLTKKLAEMKRKKEIDADRQMEVEKERAARKLRKHGK
jgi:hypothetical protein